ncbi:MAG: nucleoside monophosphate kinase [bacterium]|nr:nucleoside monophosphate kinase [bacterium]
MTNPQTFIFIGKSGCGKGTQAALLAEYLNKNHPRKIFNIETGAEFRKFINGTTYSAQMAKEIQVAGERQPDFLAINMWGQLFINSLEEGEHIIADGCPRSKLEAMVLETAFRFYKRDKPFIVYLDVSVDSVTDRLLKRGRADDQTEVIKKRLKFFEDDVRPAVDFYAENFGYNFLRIDGEPSIEEIHADLIKKLENVWQSQ